MWYAVTSKPLAAALMGALLANMTVAGTGSITQVQHAAPASTVILPHPEAAQSKPKCALQDFPVAFCRPVSLPSRYRLSERGALEYLAQALHIQMQFKGPDYAMIGQHIPYDHRVPAIKLLLRIANISYIQGNFTLMGDRLLAVHNTPLAPLAG
jgi:hypothetical protein